ncbi:uncharacterized protein LOC142301806 [Anomaloglossus baeobatrachus]|uniref:uncharacterized protein LOC142301806 n=1 Tax=Anomaloglossus baeobatrachus TaxID=238106 RepID=UPI003F5038C7
MKDKLRSVETKDHHTVTDPECLYTARPSILSLTQTNSDKDPEICLSNLWKYCSLGSRCPDMHYYLPYRWQIYKGTDWEDVPDMEEIEKLYCNPKIDSVPPINFLTMESNGQPIRRLSTVSSVLKPSEYVLTTEWLWYWKSEYGFWIQYVESNVNNMNITASSADLENVYLSDLTNDLPFLASEEEGVNFQEMKQKNLTNTKEREVRRRPRYQSFEDVKLLRGSTRSAAAKYPFWSYMFPEFWDPDVMPEIGAKKVLVMDTSIEFLEINTLFSLSSGGHQLKKIWRIQNPSLWQVYQWQKEKMKKVKKDLTVTETRLFHGTDSRHIDAICDNNFDWRICGGHGILYGQGSYFARDASYSHDYSTPTSSGRHAMFVARVLVGDFIKGDPHMKRPPLRPGSSTRYYDSCVDNITDPSIFVVFEKHQIYPEYLLEYNKQENVHKPPLKVASLLLTSLLPRLRASLLLASLLPLLLDSGFLRMQTSLLPASLLPRLLVSGLLRMQTSQLLASLLPCLLVSGLLRMQTSLPLASLLLWPLASGFLRLQASLPLASLLPRFLVSGLLLLQASLLLTSLLPRLRASLLLASLLPLLLDSGFLRMQTSLLPASLLPRLLVSGLLRMQTSQLLASLLPCLLVSGLLWMQTSLPLASLLLWPLASGFLRLQASLPLASLLPRLLGSVILRLQTSLLLASLLPRLLGSVILRLQTSLLLASLLPRLLGSVILRLQASLLLASLLPRLLGSVILRLQASLLPRLLGSVILRLQASLLPRLLGSVILRLQASLLPRLLGSVILRLQASLLLASLLPQLLGSGILRLQASRYWKASCYSH